jgi:hypothetical protein
MEESSRVFGGKEKNTGTVVVEKGYEIVGRRQKGGKWCRLSASR